MDAYAAALIQARLKFKNPYYSTSVMLRDGSPGSPPLWDRHASSLQGRWISRNPSVDRSPSSSTSSWLAHGGISFESQKGAVCDSGLGAAEGAGMMRDRHQTATCTSPPTICTSYLGSAWRAGGPTTAPDLTSN